ncbi:MAG: DUF3179 domain-containing protein [Acidobacteriota bacterium]|nr:DUF3179 domain-containing protein [Acidobacteriota bacterium]
MRTKNVRTAAIGAAARASLMLVILTVAAMGLSVAGAEGAQATKAKAKGPDLPYKTIDHPQFVSASQASFLGPKDIVLGVTDGKTAKAYPAAILSQHGVVQDSTADGPIAITW